MSRYINQDRVIDAVLNLDTSNRVSWQDAVIDMIDAMPSADVQPVIFCKDCQWLADIRDVDTGEMYHTCGALGFIIPDRFACNQGKQKGVDE